MGDMVKRLSQRSVAARSRVRFPLSPHCKNQNDPWRVVLVFTYSLFFISKDYEALGVSLCSFIPDTFTRNKVEM